MVVFGGTLIRLMERQTAARNQSNNDLYWIAKCFAAVTWSLQIEHTRVRFWSFHMEVNLVVAINQINEDKEAAKKK